MVFDHGCNDAAPTFIAVEVGATRGWVGLDELIATQDPQKVAHLVQGQLRLLELVARPKPLTPVLNELTSVLEDQISDMVSAVMLLSQDGLRLDLGAAPSMPEGYRRALDGVAVGPGGGWCALSAYSKRPVIVEDISLDQRWIDVREPALAAGFRACWAVPILSNSGRVFGTLSMYHPRPLSPSSIHLGLLSFATVLARIAIERDLSDREHERLDDDQRLAERYRMVLKATREAVWDWDLATNVVLWNEGLQALGYHPTKVASGQDWWLERIHPGEVDRVRQSLALALADTQRTSWEEEYRFRRSEGDYAEIGDRALIARDRDGVAVRMVGSMQDITRRKRQALEIQHLAERLRAATAAANVGTWQLEPPTNQFHADASLNRLLGREVRDTVEPFDEVLLFIHPDDRAELVRAQNETVDALRPFAVEHRVVLEDTAVRWFRSRGHALLDNRGQVQNIIGAVADITDLKHVEQSMALLADAARLLGASLDTEQVIAAIARMAVPAFADGALVYLRNGETGALDLAAVHAANPELDAILDAIVQSRTFHVGVPAHRVLRSGKSELHATLTPEWLSSEDTDIRIIPLVRRFHVSSLILVPLVFDDVRSGVVGFFATRPRRLNAADLAFAEELGRRASQAINNAQLLLSAKRERARAQEAQSLRERLLDIMGHDLRNPLSAVTAAVGLLKRRGLAPNQVAVVERIDACTVRMSRLIGQVMDFARIRQGIGLPIQVRQADLHEICRGVVEELRLGHPDREIGLELRGDGQVSCDPDRLAEALSNLVGNAVQHGAEGPIAVCVEDLDPDRVAIAIHNEGSIPPDAQVSIFQPYTGESLSGAHQSRSVGLGLFIAKEIVKAHRGTLGLSSTPEHGTTFTLVLERRPLGEA
jgi:PAS domain S-box-containing protein